MLSIRKYHLPSRTRALARFLYTEARYAHAHREVLAEIRREKKVRVAFLACSLSLWKNQAVVETLMQDPRFEVKVVLSPIVTYAEQVQQQDMEQLRTFFRAHHTEFVDFTFGEKPYDLRGDFNPHILFYPQSYEKIHVPEHRFESFRDRLLAYIPYSFWPGAEPWGFDLYFHRIAWKIYYANSCLMDYARSVSLIGARNAAVVGYPSLDLFFSGTHPDPWKLTDRSLKRIIWAPHFSLDTGRNYGSHSSFLDLCEGMVQLAREYAGQLQIAFKPHPKLKTVLYEWPGWGKERTDAYFRIWETQPNTLLATGEYVDLFMHSDALVHECGSFMVEYHYAQKPCLYVMKGFDAFYQRMNQLGQKALDAHYKGSSMDDVRQFIRQVVLEGSDPLEQERKAFHASQLLSPTGLPVAENIHLDLLSSLGLV